MTAQREYVWPPTQIDHVSAFCWRLWSELEGHACLCVGVKPYLDERGAYKHTRWVQTFYEWPRQRTDLYRRVVEQADIGDVYVAVALRTAAARTADTAGPSRFLWADVDGSWGPARQAIFDTVCGSGSFTVCSGTGGRHVYHRLDQAVAADEFVELNRRFAAMFDGDAKHDASAVLRLPGTWNHKPRVRRGQHPAFVWVDQFVGGVPC